MNAQNDMMPNTSNRREFLKASGKAAAGAALFSTIAARSYAAENNTIKIALVGCGGRGGGAVQQALSTQGPTKLWAMADVFPHRVESTLRNLSGRFAAQLDAPPERQFVGLDGFKQMQELRVDVLETVVLLNRGDHFEVRVLPLEAQLAPVFGVCVGDYDGDGNEDVFLSQNFFGTDLETGRYDAGRGLWLCGDGRGGFRAVPGQESGVKVYGEQRGAALSDYDGDGRVDLVVSQNAGETKLYRNEGGKAGLRVRLVGAGSNGDGIGGVVRLGAGGKWGAAREVHGGSGYWSQDSAVAVMSLGEGVAREVQVRWPGGKTTTGQVPEGAKEVRVTADGNVEKMR